MKLIRVFAIVVLSSLASSVLGQTASRDLSLPQLLVQSVEAGDSDLEVSVFLDQEDSTYQLGERVGISVTANKPAYFEVIAVGPTGNAVQLYPNAFQASALVPAGEMLTISGADSEAQVVASAPAGLELIRVVASTTPFAELPADAEAGAGAFEVVEGGAETVARDLQMLALEVHGELAFGDTLVWTTVAGDAAGAEAVEDLSIPLPADLEPSSPPAPLLALDRQAYEIGDRLRMAVTSLGDCHLWVVNVSADGSARLLFPNQLVRANRVSEGQTIIVSGRPSPVDVVAMGPEGPETIHALCGDEATPFWRQGIDFTEAFPRLSIEEGIGKALTAMPQEAAAIAGYGVTTVTVSVGAAE